MENEPSSRQGIQVISRAANILRTLEGHSEGLSLSAIAKNVKLARSTVQRIVNSLASEGFLIAASPTSRVRLGPGLVSLGSAAKADIDRVLIPHMKNLSDEVGETVDLSVQDAENMIFIDQVTTDTHQLRAVSAVGHAFSIYSCANGKAMLATMSDEEVIAFVEAHPIKALTHSTITSTEQLLTEIASIRKNGVAFDKEEHCEGVCAIGVAIEDPYGRNIAISIPVPTVRFNRNKKQLAKQLREYKTTIELALGKGAM